MKRFQIVVALLIGVVMAVLVIQCLAQRNREEEFQTAANRYGSYEGAYSAAAEKQHYMMQSCYGQQWDRYSEKILQDIESRSGDTEYLKQKSAHYAKLRDKYAAAANHPEAEIVLDPPLAP